MDRRRAERIASELHVILVVGTVALAIVALADGFLGWDLLAGPLQKLAGFLIAALVVVLAGAALVSSTLALGRIADALERSAGRAEGERRSAAP